MRHQQVSNYVYQFSSVLPPKLFLQGYDEFSLTNNSWMVKQERQRITDYDRHPYWFGIEKVRGDTLGWSNSLIDIGTSLKLIAEHTLKTKLILGRINTNIQTYGMESSFHQDGTDKDWTFMVFFNNTWNAEWGGDLRIQIDQGDYIGFTPFPNSGILFRADLEHKGDPPNRLCNFLRYSAAFTFFDYESSL